MNLIAEEYELMRDPDKEILVGYLSGADKQYYAAGCLLYLNFENPKANARECFDKNIPMAGVCIDSSTLGFNELLHEPDLNVGDVIIAVVEQNCGPEHQWVANKIMKLDQRMFCEALVRLKELNPELVKIPEPVKPRRFEVRSEK